MRRFAPNPDFNEIAERGTVEAAGEGETLIKSFRLNGTLPGVGEACGWGNRASVRPEGDGGAGSNWDGAGEAASTGVGGTTVGSIETAGANPVPSLTASRRCGWLIVWEFWLPGRVSIVRLLSLRNGLLPSSPPENSTLPFARSEPPPPSARNAAKSVTSLSRVVVGRAGEGDVCKYNIRFAASSSSARGVEHTPSACTRGGVAALPTVGAEKDDSADGTSEEGAVVVRAEL